MVDRLSSFFIFCSGIDRNVLKRTPTEFNKYAGIGATVFFTGIFAFLASSYALYTVFQNVIYSALFGLVWGVMIFNLDRYIVSSLKKKGTFLKDFTLAFPRLVLAIIISLVISKPLELKIFETEINAEIVGMQQEKRKEHETLLKSRFEKDIAKVEEEIDDLRAELSTQKGQKDALMLDALREADGTGGSKIRNMGPIYQAKMKAAQLADDQYQEKMLSLNPKIEELEAKRQEILDMQKDELVSMEASALTGFASRMEALSRVSAKSDAVMIASLFIMLLFICIETAPLFVKLISERSPYDYVLHKIEFEYEMDHKRRTTILALDTKNRIEHETKTKIHQNIETIEAENELFSEALKNEVASIKNQSFNLRSFLKNRRLTFE